MALAVSGLLNVGALLAMAVWILPAHVSQSFGLYATFVTRKAAEHDEITWLPDVAAATRVEAEPSRPRILQTSYEAAAVKVDLTSFALSDGMNPEPSSPVVALPHDVLETAVSAEAAGECIAEEIAARLQDEDLLVVWLLDGSSSMADYRQYVAPQLEPIIEQMATPPGARHQLLQAIACFGATLHERSAPTEAVDGLELPGQWSADASGEENVFAAVQQSVAYYRRQWPRKPMMIVVWTDESGDDAERVEETIRICRKQDVAVSVIGPSAVLGAENSVQAYADPESGQVYSLPVRRGPDSAAPERLELGYWFLTQEPPTELSPGAFGRIDLPAWYGNPSVPNYQCYAVVEPDLPGWYGNSDLEGLVSGFGPYALTRLAWQTGGTYIVREREERRAPFRADVIGAYQPDYRSADEYQQALRSHPLRRAVMEAVKATQERQLGPPPTILFGTRAEFPRRGIMHQYIPPAEFSRHFKTERRGLMRQAERASRIVEEALARVSEGGEAEYGLEDEYRREPSRRWRAWYDLTRGRLLAVSVRLEEYRLACDSVLTSGFLRATTNHLILVPSGKLRCDSRFRRRAAEAERLLTRCVTEHAHSPWAWLAQRELDYDLGIEVQQHELSLVSMPEAKQPAFRPPRL